MASLQSQFLTLIVAAAAANAAPTTARDEAAHALQQPYAMRGPAPCLSQHAR